MNGVQKIIWVERALFALLLLCMSGGGFAYELFKDGVSSTWLVTSVIVYFVACFGAYKLVLKVALRRVGRS